MDPDGTDTKRGADPAGHRPLHPRHGPHNPSGPAPARQPGSIRRTSTIDQLWPDGLLGRLVLKGRARDLLTPKAGAARVLGEATLTVTIEYSNDRQVVGIESSPEVPALQALVGQRASAGFRNAVDRAVPEHRDAKSLLYLLLDDVPVATLVAGYAVQYAGLLHPKTPGSRPLQHPDLCAGWRTGGTIMAGIEAGAIPVVTGPPATPLRNPSDALSWHDFGPLPPHSMRRHRRLDLIEGSPLRVDAFFRDSHMGPEAETIVHEYTIAATLAPETLRFLEITADPRVLPWLECPAAAASPSALVGRSVEGLRPYVRNEFTGILTCTHLNDTLRSLEDIDVLAGRLGS